MTTFDAFHLPGFDVAAVRDWRFLERAGLRVRWPLLAPDQLREIWSGIAASRNRALINTPVAQVVAAIDAAITEMQRDRERTTTLLGSATGYSVPVVAQTLDHMFRDWRAGALNEMLRSEIGDPVALDHPIADPHVPGKQIAAFGFTRTFHVFSGNVPGVAVTSLIRSLLVKSATLGKSASGEPVLPALFARALQTVAPEIASCLAVTYWEGGSADLEEAAIQPADAVVVYGGAEAIEGIARRVPAGRRLIIHGPRVSFGMVGPAPPPQTPGEVAQALAAYDQQGCVSPHVVYVVGDRDRARRFAHDVATQLKRLGETLPRGRLSAEEAVAIRNARTAAEFGGDTELLGEEQDGFSVIYEDAPDFRLSCLNRVLFVKPLAEPQDILQQLPGAEHLQSVALAGFPEKEKAELVRQLGLCGVSRVTSFAALPWPPMHWHHDGSAPLRELLWWQDIEG